MKLYYIDDDDLDNIQLRMAPDGTHPYKECLPFEEAKRELLSSLTHWEQHFIDQRSRAEDLTEEEVHH